MKLGGALMEPEDVFHNHERVALFVDGGHIESATGLDGWRIDWRKAISYFVGAGRFSRAYYFISEGKRPEKNQSYDFLYQLGFIVRRKPVRRYTDRTTGEQREKGEVDSDLIVEAFKVIDSYDVAVLFSGDGDLEPLVDALRWKGKRVYVVTTRNTLSFQLAHTADKPVFHLEDFRDVLAVSPSAAVTSTDNPEESG